MPAGRRGAEPRPGGRPPLARAGGRGDGVAEDREAGRAEALREGPPGRRCGPPADARIGRRRHAQAAAGAGGSAPVVAVFGATSAIAERVARLYARDGARLLLVARDGARLDAVAADLRVRGAAEVTAVAADLNDAARLGAVLEACDALGGADVALIAFGTLGDQSAGEADRAYAERELQTNFVSPALLLTELANRFEARGRGTIAVITSVAGVRGRRTNYVYGAAKAGLSAFLEGLRHRLHGRGVAVLDVRPGFVDTPMTAHLPGRGGPLWAAPERVALDIHRAIARGRPVLYTPWFWRWIMLVIRLLPRPLFHRLKI